MTPHLKNQSGFALVIALSLMAFVLILLLSISTLVQVESSASQTNKDTLQARMNALLGIQIAIGEVQTQLGPDQRVSASADLVSNEPSTARWVGVWDADNASATHTENLGWLVSRPSNATSDPAPEEPIAGSENDLARLARVNTTGTPADDYVRLPKVDISGKGHYAWWVDDEGQKARLNPGQLPGDFTKQGSHLEVQEDKLESLTPTVFNTLSASYPGIQGLTPIGDLPTTYGSLTKASTPGGLQTLFDSPAPGSEDAFKQFSSDFRLNYTASSVGLMTDVKNGGLRKNLTAAFVDNGEFAKLLADAGRGPGNNLVFGQHDSGNSVADDPGGPLWEQLKSYFRLGEAVTLNGDALSVPLLRPNPDDSNSAVSPILAQMQLFFYAGYLGSGAGEREVVYFIFPAVVLWNPYNATIDAPDLFVRATNYAPWENNNRGGFAFRFTVDDGNMPFPVKTFEEIKGPAHQLGPGGGFQNTLKFKINATAFNPGEARIFTPIQTQILDRNNPNNNELSAGLSTGLGFYHRTGKTFTPLTAADVSNGEDLPTYQIQLGGKQIYTLNWHLATDHAFAQDDIVQDVKNITSFGTWGPNDNGNKPNFPVAFPEPYIPRVFSTLEDNTNIPQDEWVYGYKSSLQFAVNNTTNPGGSEPKQWLGQFNPRGTFSGKSPIRLIKNTGGTRTESNMSYVSGVPESGTNTVADWAMISEPAFDGTARVGYSDTAAGNPKAVLFEVPHPDIPFQSIGQLGMVNFSRSNQYDDYPNNNNDRFIFNNLQPAFPLGNSLVNPMIPKELVSANWNSLSSVQGGAVGAIQDYSYRLNEALWDRFFFTSENWVDLENDENEVVEFPLTNTRLLSARKGVTYADLRDYDTTAAQLLVDGAFNINSTKVAAWESILGSFFGQSLQYSDVEADGSLKVEPNADASPFARLPVPTGEVSTTSASSSSGSVYTGFRTLDRDEIEALAQAIVDEIKTRRGNSGPFLSLSDFINRAPESSTAEHQLRGLLQAAVDTAEINKHLRQPTVPGTVNSAYDSAQFAGPLATAAPGYLMQSDLLTKLAPILSPRSDTFRIRSYGNSVDPITGESNSEVWCEAVIQRIPDPVDPNSDDPTYADHNRRFKITAFRWLTEDEI